jgi:hypothetical protein
MKEMLKKCYKNDSRLKDVSAFFYSSRDLCITHLDWEVYQIYKNQQFPRCKSQALLTPGQRMFFSLDKLGGKSYYVGKSIMKRLLDFDSLIRQLMFGTKTLLCKVTRWVREKSAQNVAQPIIYQDQYSTFFVEKRSHNIWSTFVILKKLLKVNNCPRPIWPLCLFCQLHTTYFIGIKAAYFPSW